MRPVRIISRARPIPTIRGRRWVPPSISGTPNRRSVKPSFASSVAIRRSHQSASSSPPARHQPEIAAIAGFDGVSRVNPSGPSGKWESQRLRVDAVLGGLGERLQVGARAERLGAVAGEDERARLVVGLEAVERLAQRKRGGGVDSVPALGTRDREDRCGADTLVAGLGHWLATGCLRRSMSSRTRSLRLSSRCCTIESTITRIAKKAMTPNAKKVITLSFVRP